MLSDKWQSAEKVCDLCATEVEPDRLLCEPCSEMIGRLYLISSGTQIDAPLAEMTRPAATANKGFWKTSTH